MKVGDIVMFTGGGRYAKYFWGQMGEVIRYVKKSDKLVYDVEGPSFCRVKWFQPVPYLGRVSTISDLNADCFEVISE